MQLNVIPYPSIVDHVGPDLLTLAGNPSISCCAALQSQAEYLQLGLQQRFSTPATVQQRAEDAAQDVQSAIRLQTADDLPALWPFRWSEEGYELVCTAQGITITALSSTGVLYGIQTLLQALRVSSDAQQLCMPHTRVVDAPRFIWRGVLLDVGRHFFPVPFILKLLDLLALYKMNRFHWHLTEDQGWRLDVPSMPRLAEVAAWRGTRPAAAAPAAPAGSKDNSGQQQEAAGADPTTSQPASPVEGQQQHPQQQQQQQQGGELDPSSVLGRPTPSAATFHGGFYTQEDVAKVIAYAAERSIEVVPEIELPGHCVAALAAYPHLSCTGDVSAVSTHWGIHEDVYCAVSAETACVQCARTAETWIAQSLLDDGNDQCFSFLEGVLDQVISQFPCPYIHIGGDEVPKVRWEECPKCQARMDVEGLETEAELQSWFVRRISNYLAANNRKLIGWDEILEGGLAEGATVMSWRGNIGGIIAAKSGHDVIMTPTSHCYFDYRQAPSAAEPGAWYACLPLHVVYAYDPIPGPWQAVAAEGQDEQDEDAVNAGVPDAVMTSAPGSSAGNEGDSPPSCAMGDDSCSSGTDTVAQQQDQQGPPASNADTAAAVVQPAAAEAAGPHYPGHPPGASLAPLAAATALVPGVPGSSGSSSGRSRQGVLTDAEASQILGSQANLWTEYVSDEATAEYMLLPRLAALAEAVWTPVEVKDWDGFMARLQDHLPLLNRLGYLYRPIGP